MAETVRRVDYYYTTVADEPGEGARLLAAFKEAGVNFLALHAFPAEGGKAQVDFVPQDRESFLAAARAAGVELSEAKTAFLLEGEDRVGATADTLAKLAAAGINVTAGTSIVSGGRYGTLLWVRPSAVASAAAALGA